MNKKGFFLLLLFVLPILGAATFLHFQQRKIRSKVKREILKDIDEQDLTFHIFHKKDAENLHWKHSKEYVFQGAYFDVVRKEIHGDSIKFWSFNDTEETQLSNKIDTLIHAFFQKNQENKQTKAQLHFSLNRLFFEHHFIEMGFPNSAENQPKSNKRIHFSLQDYHCETDHPPECCA